MKLEHISSSKWMTLYSTEASEHTNILPQYSFQLTSHNLNHFIYLWLLHVVMLFSAIMLGLMIGLK